MFFILRLLLFGYVAVAQDCCVCCIRLHCCCLRARSWKELRVSIADTSTLRASYGSLMGMVRAFNVFSTGAPSPTSQSNRRRYAPPPRTCRLEHPDDYEVLLKDVRDASLHVVYAVLSVHIPQMNRFVAFLC